MGRARGRSDVTVEQLLLAEGLRFDEHGRPSYIGVISRGVVAALPATIDSFCVALEVWGPPERRLDLTLRILGPSGALVKEEPLGVVPLDESGTRSLGGMFEDVTFVEEGLHRLGLWSGERLLRSRRFLVEIDPQEAGLTL